MFGSDLVDLGRCFTKFQRKVEASRCKSHPETAGWLHRAKPKPTRLSVWSCALWIIHKASRTHSLIMLLIKCQIAFQQVISIARSSVNADSLLHCISLRIVITDVYWLKAFRINAITHSSVSSVNDSREERQGTWKNVHYQIFFQAKTSASSGVGSCGKLLRNCLSRRFYCPSPPLHQLVFWKSTPKNLHFSHQLCRVLMIHLIFKKYNSSQLFYIKNVEK